MNSCEYGFVAGCLHSKVGPQVHLGVDFIVDIVHYESSNWSLRMRYRLCQRVLLQLSLL